MCLKAGLDYTRVQRVCSYTLRLVAVVQSFRGNNAGFFGVAISFPDQVSRLYLIYKDGESVVLTMQLDCHSNL